MTAVKGSKQYRMKVVPYRPWSGAVIVASVAAAMALGVAASYFYGHFDGRAQQAEAIAERDALRVDVAEVREQNEDLRQQVANLQLGTQVDRQANEDVRAEVVALKDKLAEQQEVISFYRGLMSPTDNKRGLTIGSLSLNSADVARHVEYKLVVKQLATNHKLLSGYLTFSIVGRQEGVPTTLQLKDVSDQVGSEKIKLRFKYFQNLEGQLLLPEGFEPYRIEVLAQSSGKNAVTVTENFDWLVREG